MAIAGTRNGALELVVRANTRAAAEPLKGIAALVGDIGRAASNVIVPFNRLGQGMVGALAPAQAAAGGLALSLLNPFSILGTIIRPLLGLFDSLTFRVANLQKTGDELQKNPFIGTALAKILKEAEAQVENLDNKLTDVLVGVRDIGGSLLQGAVPGFAKLEQVGSSVANKLGVNFSQIGPKVGAALNQVDVIIDKILTKAERIPQRLAGAAGTASNIVGNIAGFSEPLEIFGAIRTAVGATTQSMFVLTQEIGFFLSGLQALKQFVAAGPFNLLIQQNVQLQEQLLSTKSSLASTNKIFESGQVIGDPTKAIKALDAPISAAISRLRQGSLELVGVTSKELVPVFDIIAGQASQVGINLNQSVDLALSAAAALGTMGLNLGQARQEVTSILMGTIDMNSVMAKSLGINNQMVATWRSQGKIFEELTKRLEAFRAGNALAAQTINGVYSNIEEIIDEIGRLAGEQLLAPIVKQLNVIYDYLNKNKAALTEYLTGIVGTVMQGVMAAVDALGQLFNATSSVMGQVFPYLAKSLSNFLIEGSNAIKAFLPVVQPLIEVFAELAKSALALGGPFLKTFLMLKTVELGTKTMAGGFNILAQLLPGVGELLFILTGRNAGLVKSFVGLKSEIGTGAAGFLLLGKNLEQIPALMNLLSNQISKFIPIFGPAIAAMTPAFAGVLVQVLGLTKAYPALGEAMGKVFKGLPGTITGLPGIIDKMSPLVDKILPGAGFLMGKLKEKTEEAAPSLEKLAGAISGFTDKGEAMGKLDKKFSNLMQLLGGFLAKNALKFSMLGIGVYTAIQALDRFILKNAAVGEAVAAVAQGFGEFIGAIFKTVGSAIQAVFDFVGSLGSLVGMTNKATKSAKSFGETINDFLLNPITLATVAVVGLIAAGEKIAALQGGLMALQLGGMAQGAVQASIGFQALKVALTQGTTASAVYMATNGVNVVTLGLLKEQIWGNVLGMRALIVEKIRAAVIMARQFIVSCLTAIASLRNLRLSTTLAAFSFGLLGNSATGAGNALTFAAVKARIGGIMTALTGAVTAAAGGFATLTTAIWTAISGFLAVAAPIALVAAGVAAIGLVRYTKDLADSTEATELFGAQSDQLAVQSIQLAQALKNRYAQQEERTKNGIALSEEEYKANQRLGEQSKGQIKDITAKITELKAQQDQAKGDANKNAIGAQIGQLERMKALLEGMTNNVQMQAKDLPRLGTAYEQFAKEVSTALLAMQKPSGDADLYKKQAEVILTNTQAQLKAGMISAEQATRRYEMLANNVNLDKDTQIKAQQAITEAVKLESDRQVENAQAKTEQAKVLADTGRVSEIEGERRVTKLKEEELNTRLEALKKSKAAEDKIRTEDLQKQLAQVDKQIAEAQKKAAAAAGDPKAIREVQQEQFNALSQGREKTLAEITQTEEAIKQLQAEAASKKGAGADEAYNKAVDLQRKADELKKSLTETDVKLKNLQNEAQNPQTPQKDEKAAKEATATVTKLQQEKLSLQAQFERASTESTRKFNNEKSKLDAERQRNEAEKLKKEYEQKLRFQEENQKILEGQFADGEVSEEAFAERTLNNTRARLEVERVELVRQWKLLASTDKEGQHRILAQGEEIRKKLSEAEEVFYQQQVQRLERAQRRILDVAKEAEAKREIEIQELLSDKSIDRDEREARAGEERAKAKNKTLLAELDASKQFEDELSRLPRSNDPIKEEERQAKIRGARLKTQEVTSQILENQRSQEDAHTKYLQEQIENRYEVEENALTSQSKASEFMIRSLERQNQLLEARKELQSAFASYVDGEYQLAEKLTTSERKKQKIQESAARARLKFLEREQQLEAMSVQLEYEKNKALLQQEEIQNRLEQARAQADYAKVIVDPNASDQEKNAAGLRVAVADYNEQLINQKKQDEDDSYGQRQKKLEIQQSLKRDQARADIASTTRTKRDDRLLANEFLYKATYDDRLFNGVESKEQKRKSLLTPSAIPVPGQAGSPGSPLPSFDEFLKTYQGPGSTAPVSPVSPVTQGSLGKLQAMSTGATGRASRALLSPPPLPTLSRNNASTNQPREAGRELFVLVGQILSSMNAGFAQLNINKALGNGGGQPMNNTFYQTFTGTDVKNGNVGKQVEKQVFNALFNVANVSKQQQRAVKTN